MKIYSMNLSDDFFCIGFEIWFEKYSVTHPRKKLEDNSETIFILVFILMWKIFGDKSDTKILESRYEIILSNIRSIYQ